jgi:ATP-dependent Clp protease protease subunit
MKYLNLYGSVDTAMYKKVIEVIQGLSGYPEWQVTINSPGGDFTDGKAIYSILSTAPVMVTTMAYGACDSAAVLIFAAGQKRVCTEDTTFLLHDASGKVKGSVPSIKEYAAKLRAEDVAYNNILERATGTPSSHWDELSHADTILTATQAKDLGLVTHILKRGKK